MQGTGRWRRLVVRGAVVALVSATLGPTATAAGTERSRASAETAVAEASSSDEVVLFSIPVGPGGITYGGLLPEQRPWGPAAIVADPDGSLWIADTAANRILGYSQSGERFAEILLAGRAVGVTDIAPIGTRLALLDAASYPPTVITVEKADGRTVSVRELPKAASLEAGLRGISVDRDLRLYADVGSLGVLLDDEVSSAVPGEAGAFGAAVIKADKRQTGAERHAATVTYRGESFALSVKHALVGLHLVGDAADRSAFAVDEAVTDAAGILRVDRTIHMIGATGREIGLARVPIASSLYIQHGVTMTRKGDVIALLARASSIDIVRLDPRATVPSILPDDSVATVQRVATAAPAGTETVTACRAFLTMYNSAKGYSDNSKSLNTANISGPCPNRTKPRYLTTAKVYSSVSYDWDGFETVSA